MWPVEGAQCEGDKAHSQGGGSGSISPHHQHIRGSRLEKSCTAQKVSVTLGVGSAACYDHTQHSQPGRQALKKNEGGEDQLELLMTWAGTN